MLLSIGSTLAAVARIAVTVGMMYLFYWIVRLILRRIGGLRAANPFQPGWGQLREQYESSHSVSHMTRFSARIGGIWYDELQIGFDTQEVVIRNNIGFSSLVRVPYSHIVLLQQPESFQATRLSETEYIPGLFQAGMVEIGLDMYWTDQLLLHMAAENSAVS